MSANEGTPRPNRLAGEKSPYLLQHAHNPVQWYPWGPEALDRSKRENKPIFLSIGYSTCHWCHVMERESFENESIAAVMNQHFVCIKVDREERPDLDEIYMAAVQALTGQGGWPLSAWLTPELQPFYGGTYFPPDDRYGRPGFPRVLEGLAALWREKPDEARVQAGKLTAALGGLGTLPAGEGELSRALVDDGYDKLLASHDPRHGGWGSAPKFPRSDFGSLALRVHARTGDDRALEMVTSTLDAMARGGMIDHLGGGFARYSTDERWLVPHFEKMLYDNAQLALHYTEAFQLTGTEDYRRVVVGILDYVARDMTHPDGGFYSAEDADSEGEEGLFYVWSAKEISALLPEDEHDLFVAHYGVSESGNWEGHNVLERVVDVDSLAKAHGIDRVEVEARLASARQRLLKVRAKRIRPGLDDKILTAWNGLMIGAYARAGVVLEERRYVEAAAAAAQFVLRELRDEQGALLRRWRDGESRFAAYAEDYAFLVSGLLELAQADFDLEMLRTARQLHEDLFAQFGDGSPGALYHTRAGCDDLLVRARAGYDGSVPTANSVAARNAITLFELTGETAYADQAEGLLCDFVGTLERAPLALTNMLVALDAWLSDRTELVIASTDPDELWRWACAARRDYRPDLVVVGLLGEPESDFPLLQGKVAAGGRTTAYVCRAFACESPVDTVEAMLAALDGRRE